MYLWTYLWWSLCTLYLHACQVSYRRSLQLCLCYVFWALISSLVCWFIKMHSFILNLWPFWSFFRAVAVNSVYLCVPLSLSLINTNLKLYTFSCDDRLFHPDTYMNQHTSITKHYCLLTCTTWGLRVDQVYSITDQEWTRCTLSLIRGGPGVLYHWSGVDQVYSITKHYCLLTCTTWGLGVDQVYSITDQGWTRCTLSLIRGGPGVLYHQALLPAHLHNLRAGSGPGVLYHWSGVDQVYSITNHYCLLTCTTWGVGVDQVYSITDQGWTRCTLSPIITACLPVQPEG